MVPEFSILAVRGRYPCAVVRGFPARDYEHYEQSPAQLYSQLRFDLGQESSGPNRLPKFVVRDIRRFT